MYLQDFHETGKSCCFVNLRCFYSVSNSKFIVTVKYAVEFRSRKGRRDMQVEFVGFSTLFEEVSVFGSSDGLFPSHHWKTFNKSNLPTLRTYITVFRTKVYFELSLILGKLYVSSLGRGVEAGLGNSSQKVLALPCDSDRVERVVRSCSNASELTIQEIRQRKAVNTGKLKKGYLSLVRLDTEGIWHDTSEKTMR